jgi:hypothetical protein
MKRSTKLDYSFFFKLIDRLNYPNKSENLKYNSSSCDINYTYRVINEISRRQAKKIKEILKNLKNKLESVIENNNLGSIENWSLYIIYLEKLNNNKIVLNFGLECIKPPASNFKKNNSFIYSIDI